MERYEAYKDSGVEWIGKVPNDWDVRRIKTAVRRKSDSGHPDETVLSLYRDYGIVIKDSRDDNFNRTSENTDSYRFVEINDLVVNKMKAWQGSLAISEYQGIVSPAYYVYSITDPLIFPRYMHYQLRDKSYLPEYRRLSGGIRPAQWDLSSENFVNIPMLVPTMPEQQAIVDFLDNVTIEIDSLITDCEREVELLQEYRKAIISEAVTKGLDPDAPMKDSGVEWIGDIPEGWEAVGFKTYLTNIIDYRGRTPEKVDEGVFLITGRNIKQGRIRYDLSQEYMREDEFESVMSRGKLIIGNVLFTMEAPLGEVALIDRDDCAAAQRIVQLCCNKNELLGAYLVYWIMSDQFQNDLKTYATGSTASGIKASKLGKLRLVHPPINEQCDIISYLDAKTAEIDSLIEAKQQMADKLREYRKSLISEAVTGKFKVPGVK